MGREHSTKDHQNLGGLLWVYRDSFPGRGVLEGRHGTVRLLRALPGSVGVAPTAGSSHNSMPRVPQCAFAFVTANRAFPSDIQDELVRIFRVVRFLDWAAASGLSPELR